MELKTILVTPLLAEQYLQSNVNNRPIDKATIERYVNQIKLGLWKPRTGECIKLSKTNKLLDGQHRLTAIIKAGIPVELDFITGIEDTVFDVLDTGNKRTAGDVLALSGVKYANVMASIISLSDVFQNGKFISGGATKRLTNAQILEEYNKDPEKWNDLHAISSKWYQDFSRILNPSPIAAFYNVFSTINKDKAKDFFDQLCGFNTEFSSIKLLKKILTDDKLSTSKKLTASKRNALIIKAWNFFVNNTEIKMLKFDPKVEKFPTI